MGSPSRTGRGLTRRGFLRAGLGGAAAAGALVAGCAPEAERRGAAGPARPPNIVFVLADDLGYGDLGCYGQRKVRTPHLDALAAEGMRFTQAYAGSTVCAPSRCCLMTGLHTGHARVRGNALVPLVPEDVTVAEVLRGADRVARVPRARAAGVTPPRASPPGPFSSHVARPPSGVRGAGRWGKRPSASAGGG
jgi:hypothetical protein